MHFSDSEMIIPRRGSTFTRRDSGEYVRDDGKESLFYLMIQKITRFSYPDSDNNKLVRLQISDQNEFKKARNTEIGTRPRTRPAVWWELETSIVILP